ncbi:aminopeptidase N-like [Tubulanus polymorphus]|uniref:aminopeptidase N-like n=1 Tax=Tubulanus polymorphus TaxID=672921 RepID=UPI003DA462BD
MALWPGYFGGAVPRLPSHVTPSMYELTIRPIFDDGMPESSYSFSGAVRITIECNAATDRITVHKNADLTVDENSALITAKNGDSGLKITGWSYDPESEFYTARLNRKLTQNHRYVLDMSFTGRMLNNSNGVYYSVDKHDDISNVVVSTQMQPLSARKVFPCFDEPALKAEFAITVVRRPEMMSLSNGGLKTTRETSIKYGDGWVDDVFETTPVMSSYLVAFVVFKDYAKFKSAENQPVPVSIWGPQRKIQLQGEYAQKIANSLIQYFGDYFNIPYAMSKLDLVAVPHFEAGAMENWGLNIFREITLLFAPDSASNFQKQEVANVVAHEIAHQWFGNLVTMAWWDDLWLNEGFACYVAHLGASYAEPELYAEHEQILLNEALFVMKRDSYTSSKPVYNAGIDPSNINELFDYIPYYKSILLLRMLNFFVGDENFKKGVNEANGLSVGEKFEAWIKQKGYPIVNIIRDSATTARVTQEHFLIQSGDESIESDLRWHIPLTFTSEVNPQWVVSNNDVIWVDSDITLNGNDGYPPSDSWIVANVKQMAYIRVNYDQDNWKMLAAQLKSDHREIHVINRGSLIDDAFNLNRANKLSISVAFDLVKYIGKDNEYYPWILYGRNLAYITSMLEGDTVYPLYSKMLREQADSNYNILGWEAQPNDSFSTKKLRRKMISQACGNGHKKCSSVLRQKFETWKNEPNFNTIDVDLKDVVYCNAIRFGSEADWNFVYERMVASDNGQEKETYRRALTCSQDRDTLARYLTYSLDTNIIDSQDAYDVIRSIAFESKLGRELAWTLFVDNFETIKERYADGFLMSIIVDSITANMRSQDEVDKLRRFFDDNKQDIGDDAHLFEAALNKANSNKMWADRNLGELQTWLQNNATV